MVDTPPKSPRYVRLASPTTGIGPDGRGMRVPAGVYRDLPLDGVDEKLVYLAAPTDPTKILACVQRPVTSPAPSPFASADDLALASEPGIERPDHLMAAGQPGIVRDGDDEYGGLPSPDPGATTWSWPRGDGSRVTVPGLGVSFPMTGSGKSHETEVIVDPVDQALAPRSRGAERVRRQREVTAMVALDTIDALAERVLNLLASGRRMSMARRYVTHNHSPDVLAGLTVDGKPNLWDRVSSATGKRDAAGLHVPLQPGLTVAFGFAAHAEDGNEVEADVWARYHAKPDDRRRMTEVAIVGGVTGDGPAPSDALTIRHWNSNGVCDERVIAFDYASRATDSTLAQTREALRLHIATLRGQQPWDNRAMFERVLAALDAHTGIVSGGPMPVFVLKAKDVLAVDLVREYQAECRARGLHDQAEQVQRAIGEMLDWQAEHPDEVHLPDHEHVPAGQRHHCGAPLKLVDGTLWHAYPEGDSRGCRAIRDEVNRGGPR